MNEQQEFYIPCSHPYMEYLPQEQIKDIIIHKCTVCGFEDWHHEDAHG